MCVCVCVCVCVCFCARVPAATTVALPKDGPVHDVQWAPTGDYFLTVAGFMPAKVRAYAHTHTHTCSFACGEDLGITAVECLQAGTKAMSVYTCPTLHAAQQGA